MLTRLYPILLYIDQSFFPIYTQSNLAMLSRVHRKTIQGVPTRCRLIALKPLIGSLDILDLIVQRQLCFANSLAAMSPSDMPKKVLEARLRLTIRVGIIPVCRHLSSLSHSLSLVNIIILKTFIEFVCNRTPNNATITKTMRGKLIQVNAKMFYKNTAHIDRNLLLATRKENELLHV